MKTTLLIAVLALVWLAPAVSCQSLVQFSQTLPPNMDTLEGDTFVNDPFTNGGTQRWQWVYDSSYFNIQRPVIINAIAFRADGGAGLSPFDFPQVQVRMASATANHSALSTTNLTGNLASDVVMVRNPLQWTSPAVAANTCGTSPWVDLLLGQSFFYNPAQNQDLVIEVTICNTSVPWTAGIDAVNGPVMGSRYGDVGSCNGNTGTTFPDVPVMRVNYVTTPQWQTNALPQVAFDINGLPQSPFGPIQLNTAVGITNVLSFQSSLLGMGWEFASTVHPGISAAQGALTTPGGQLVNIDLSQGDIFLFNNLSFPPWFGNFVLPVAFPAPLFLGAQMHIFDFSHPDFSRLSAMGQISVSPGIATLGAPVAGPTADDTSVGVNIGGFPFFNQVFTQIQVSDNGRIMFGATPNDDPAPNTPTEYCADPPSVGYWADLDPTVGTITVSSPSGFMIRVDYAGVPYSGENPAITNTFAILLNGLDGTITVEGVNGIAPHPQAGPNASDAWLGVSGGIGTATNGGATAFTVAGPALATSPTNAIYEWGTAGTLAPTLTSLRFNPTSNPAAAPNFSWTGF